MAQDPEDDGPAKTVFEPLPPSSGGGRNAPEDAWLTGGSASNPPAPAEDDEAAAVAPKGRRGRKAVAPQSTILQPSAPPQASTPQPMHTGAPFGAPGAVGPGRVSIGSVLNHIYEVRRFIARGGMGEVYEGINVNTDERVAIKVVLPHLAADPNVQAMFRKEARTLTRLSHPALVQYRVLANEPVLGVLYIVTDYLDGVGLDQLIGKLKLTQADLLSLMKRLCEGLRVAHDLGAIHRDISPDNILLPGERIESATIIDFGIAKDLESSHATIVGDGFAGKLAFVAPEQFGDFGREIGPWTDIYSLGLVMLAVAGGKNADMGSTLVEAVDRRRAGPDLTVLPAPLKPLFGKLLAPNPKDRFRSMNEVLEAIASVQAGGPLRMGAAPAAERPARETRPPKPEKPPKPPRPPRSADDAQPIYLRPPVIAGAIAVAILAVGIPVVMNMMGPDDETPAGPAVAGSTADHKLRSISCSWLEAGEGSVVRGAAQSGFEGAASRAVKSADISGVLFVEGQSCSLMEAVRPLKAPTVPGAEWVKAVSPSFTPARQVECGDDPRQALVFVDVDTAPASGQDMALYLLRPGGTVQAIFRSTAQIRPGAGLIKTVRTTGANSARIGLCNDLQGPYGLLALRGAGPFTDDSGGGGPIADRLASDAKAGGWTSQMDWYTVQPVPAAATIAPPPVPVPAPVVAPPPPRPQVKASEKVSEKAPPRREPPRPAPVVKPKPKPPVEQPVAPKSKPARCTDPLGCD
jgi:serine/threonine-protein kinase